jgi:aminopeptidase N
MSTLDALEANLTREEAICRAERVGDVSVQLQLHLRKDAESFDGDVVLSFATRPGSSPVFLDCLVTELLQVSLNGTDLPGEAWDGTRLWLPEERLQEKNRLKVKYCSRYGSRGTGFHRFVDPEDGNEFIYTNCEPYDAHRVLPCFDQPDLKATFSLEVLAPVGWQVISNLLEESIEDLGEERRWVFPQGPRISTYLFHVSSGPMVKWEDERARIPSRLFARPSMAQFVDPEAVFEVTRRGFDFYEEYFETPYPFSKYDQVFAPEFMTGAMENVGAVLINDIRYCFRHQPSQDERLERSMVILHEMAHMWFGNLVTMRWWDGLWLNESFATYMSFLALDAATDFDTGWVYFDHKIRSWALWQDELPTTHPIECDVPEVQAAFSNFDGITYGKGCCVLKQLATRLGDETFRKGVAGYLQRYAWSNTSNQDFLQALSEAAGQDLGPWAKVWLLKDGVNTIRCRPLSEGGKVTALELIQEPGNGSASLRSHKVRVAVFYEGEGGRLAAQAEEVLLEGESTRLDLPALPSEPRLFHPNVSGSGYFKIALDEGSLHFLKTGLHRLEVSAVRSSLVDVTRQMVRDVVTHPADFLRGVLAHLPREEFLPILETYVGFIPTVLGSYLEGTIRDSLAAGLHQVAWKRLEACSENDEQGIWFRLLVGSAFDEASLTCLEGFLDGRLETPFDLDSRRRWELVERLVVRGREGALVRLEAEEARDSSDLGKLTALGIRSGIPDPEAKAAAWETFVTSKNRSLEQCRAAYGGFHRPGQGEILAPYTERFFLALPDFVSHSTSFQAVAFAKGLFPFYDEKSDLEARTEELLADRETLGAAVTRTLAERLDDHLRWRRILQLGRSANRGGGTLAGS